MRTYAAAVALALLTAISLCAARPAGGASQGNNNFQHGGKRVYTVTDQLECGLTGTIKVRIDLKKKITITVEGKKGEQCYWEGMTYEYTLTGKGSVLGPTACNPGWKIHKVVFQLDGSGYTRLEIRLDVRDAREQEKHHLFVKLECDL